MWAALAQFFMCTAHIPIARCTWRAPQAPGAWLLHTLDICMLLQRHIHCHVQLQCSQVFAGHAETVYTSCDCACNLLLLCPNIISSTPFGQLSWLLSFCKAWARLHSADGTLSHSSGSAPDTSGNHPQIWAARYNAWFLIELTPKGVVFLSCSFQITHKGSGWSSAVLQCPQHINSLPVVKNFLECCCAL